MPMYEYECQTCKKVFTLALSFDQHDHNRVTCPGCQSSEVRQLISSFIAKTASKT
jgi:putative FmdB family regulatory protein